MHCVARTPLSVLPPSGQLESSLSSSPVPDVQRVCIERACALLVGSTTNPGHLVIEEILRLYLGINLPVEHRTPPTGSAPDGIESLSLCAHSSSVDTLRHSNHTSPAIPARVSPQARQEQPDRDPDTRATPTMAKKRRSLQSLFSPASLTLTLPPDSPSTSHTSRARSHSAAAPTTRGQGSISSLPDLPLLDLPAPPTDSPPADLLDEDPFANLSPAPSMRRSRPPSLVLAPADNASLMTGDTVSLPPRSPLSLSASSSDTSFSFVSSHSLPSTPPSTPILPQTKTRLTRPKSSGSGQSHVFIPKVRRGRVGAQLPAEPWNQGEPGSSRTTSRSPETRRRTHLRRPTELSTIRDSRMVLDGQPFFVGDGSPLDHKAKLNDDGSYSAQELVLDPAEDPSAVPHLLRAYSDPYPCRSASPPLATPLLYPSSPTSSSDCHSAEHFLPLENTYPDVTYSSSSSSSSARHTRYFDGDLIATLDYNYADAVSKLGGPPSPNASVILDPAAYFSSKSKAEKFEPGTSADTVRALLIRRPVSDDPELPVSPDSSTSEFSLSTSSSGHSRASSTASTDYGEEVAESSDLLLDDASDRISGFGIPWPSRAHTPPLSCYGMYTFPDADSSIVDDISGRLSPASGRSSYYYPESGMDEPVDGGEDRVTRSSTNGQSGGSGYGGNNGSRSNGSGYGNGSSGMNGGYGGHGGSGGGRRGNDGDDDRNRRPAGRSLASPSSESDTSEEEEDSSDEDNFATPPSTIARSQGSQEDDVPLAQQIPTALKAQRTIRRQVRNEIDQRRRERTIRADDRTLRPRSPNDRNEALARSASAKATAAAAATENTSIRTLSGTTPRSPQKAEALASSSKPVGRPRTKTLPGVASNPLSLGDLTKKLIGVQTSGVLPAVISRSQRPSVDLSVKPARVSSTRPPSRDTSLNRGQDVRDVGRSTTLFKRPSRAVKDVSDQADARGRSLRPTRSFHRPSITKIDLGQGPPLPLTGVSLGRAETLARKRPSQEPLASMSSPKLPEEHRALERARSVKPSSRRPSVDHDRPRMPSVEPESISAALRARTRKPSVTAADHPSAPSHAVVSPFAALSGASQISTVSAKTLWQQRIFVGNMQKYVVVEIGPSTNAAEILQIVDSQGALDDGAGSGGWMLWEVAQDFGMERPVRGFEMLSDVCGSWNTDKIVNLLVIKKTLLAPILSRSAIPRSSPICSGYVQHEYKRGKWQKRWMELREHSLWLSKRDTGKDAVFLCSLNNFDAYYVTRPHKAPKPYVFAVKSTDSLTFFENTADYVHVFACGEGEGKNWLEKILLARSYVLYQERNVISSTAGGLGRAGTSRAGQRSAQPLVNVAAPKADGPISASIGFEPGSLLAKRQPI